MKTLVFVLTALFSSISFANNSNCGNTVENHFRAQSYQTKPAELQKTFENGQSLYHIRTNLHGGDAAWQVTTDTNCNLLEVKLLWAE